MSLCPAAAGSEKLATRSKLHCFSLGAGTTRPPSPCGWEDQVMGCEAPGSLTFPLCVVVPHSPPFLLPLPLHVGILLAKTLSSRSQGAQA